ncbi:MAG: U32 family peptidase [Ruminococcaceae bacterium]|nr:U32 family peptidase [Oscillospiraceae bacterium]
MKRPEVLAPVGSPDSLYAAVRSGADAVYMGCKGFNARIKADNFGDDEIKDAIAYCHSHGVKVHITMNTLISDEEIPEALETLKRICAAGADAVIVQDLGLASLMKEAVPALEKHASTQMSVQTREGVKLLKQMGFSRAVLPRELTKEEIRSIKDSTDIEIEIFIHGALCMSVSGQCYMSSMFGGRSGNRGLCAQPCRLPFRAENGTGNDLSLKDLSLIERAQELTELGIDSLKIEGRMKRPEYVAAAVTAIRSTLDGKADEEILSKLRAVFSRSGFTDGYFADKKGREMFGIRQKEDVTSATAQVLKDLSRLYEKEKGTIPVSFFLTVINGERVSLSASAIGRSVFVEEDFIPERAVSKPLTIEGLTDRISKCGGTQFFAEKTEIDLDEGLIVPAGVINNLRRRALSELEKAISSVKEINFTDIDIGSTVYKAEQPLKFNVRIARTSQLPDNLGNVENLYIPLNFEENFVENVKNLPVNVGIEVPRGIFGYETLVEKYLLRAKEKGISIAYCSTLDALALARKHGFTVHTGFSMNVFNSYSVSLLESLGVKEITLSPELTLKRLSKTGGTAKRGIIGYGRLPLMLTRNCPVKNGTDCNDCKSNKFLTDRKNMKFPVVCHFGCSEILNSQPIYLGDRLGETENLDFITFYFTKEKKEICEAILDAYRKGRSVKGEYTRGLYYRGLEG